MSILASNDDGVSFAHIGGYQSGVSGVTSYTVAVNSTSKYKTFKLVKHNNIFIYILYI